LRPSASCFFWAPCSFFARAIGNDFVGYDDPDYVTKNYHVLNGLGWDGLKWAFSSGGAANLWHPLT